MILQESCKKSPLALWRLFAERKHGHAAFDVLLDLFAGNCWMPGEARV